MINNLIKRSKKAQEEMVGFAIIMVIVFVILLIFLGFSIKNNQKETVESYEVESFINAFLEYTTTCRDVNDLEYFPINKLVFECSRGNSCLGGESSCDVLENTLGGILAQSWDTGPGSPIKGYGLNITSNGANLVEISDGNKTGNSKGFSVERSKSSTSIEFFFTAYY